MAALAAAGVASAQSSVSIFGVLDLSLGQTTTERTVVGSGGQSVKATNLAGVNSANGSNQLGFRGTEDLGGGLTAGFMFAVGTNPGNVSQSGNVNATGSGNGTPFGQVREAFVSLESKSWGRVAIGSQNTLATAWSGAAAALQASDIGGSFYATLNGTGGNGRYAQSMLVNPATAGAGSGARDATATGRTAGRSATQGSRYMLPNEGLTGLHPRLENMLSYITPTFDGLSGGISYFRTDSVTDNSPAAAPANAANRDTQSKLTGTILRADYSKGPWEVHYAYTMMDQKAGVAGMGLGWTLNTNAVSATAFTNATGPAAAEVTNHLLHVRYDLGVAVPWLIYTNGRNKTSVSANAAAAGTIDAKGYEIGVRVPMGAANPYILMGRGDLSASGVTSSVEPGKVEVKALQVGMKYTLSKRSTLFGAYGYSKFNTTSGAYAGDKDEVKGFRLGVTHTF